MRKWLAALLLVLAASTSCFFTHKLYSNRDYTAAEEFSRFVFFPGSLIKIVALEFPGVFSDYLLLNFLVLHGERIIDKKELSENELQVSFMALEKVTELDPWFWDTYVLAEMTFPWDTGKINETNELLKKAIEYRPDDYRPYYYIWFNYFYFLKNPTDAAPYLEMASQKPGAPTYFKNLAARMRVYSGELQAGIVFLQQMIRETNNESDKKWYEMRLHTLQALELLESAVREYKKKYKQAPTNINELLTGRILKAIPPDPYGGEFYIMEGGRVYTTSNMAFSKAK